MIAIRDKDLLRPDCERMKVGKEGADCGSGNGGRNELGQMFEGLVGK